MLKKGFHIINKKDNFNKTSENTCVQDLKKYDNVSNNLQMEIVENDKNENNSNTNNLEQQDFNTKIDIEDIVIENVEKEQTKSNLKL